MASKTRATINDVARLAQVSTKSISRVINGEPGVSEETKLRILEAMNTLGYVARPITQKSRDSAKAIGLVISGFEDYAGEIVRGMSRSAEHLGYNLVLYVQHAEAGSADPYEAFINNGLLAGLLMLVPFDYNILLELCGEHELPYVMIDYEGQSLSNNVPAITVTNRKGVLDATRYLLALGHRQIGFITGQMIMASSKERLQGYRDALEEVGIPYDETLVIEGNWTQKVGFRQTLVLLERRPDLTAIIASDDVTAFGAMDAIKEMGLRVGEDISVIGFDDIPMAAEVHPPLTTIRQPMHQMGEAAVELLVSLLEGRAPVSVRRDFATELIIRKTTGKPSNRTK